MGWAAGSEVFDRLYSKVRKYLPEDQRKQFVEDLVDALEDQDWDTQHEVVRSSWPEVREVLQERKYFDDEEY